MQIAVQNKKELIERILASEKHLRSCGVKSIGIFGSFVRDQATQTSDVDFYIDIDIEYKTLKNLVALANYLQNLTGRKAEIVTPQSLNKYTGKYIIQEVEYVPFAA